jgi:hypothetical protein
MSIRYLSSSCYLYWTYEGNLLLVVSFVTGVMFKNERRVFRGRGGPNDRKLPKHNARRRRRHPFGTTEQQPPPETTPSASLSSPGAEIGDVQAIRARESESVTVVEKSIAANLSIVSPSPRVDSTLVVAEVPDMTRVVNTVLSRDRRQSNDHERSSPSAFIDESTIIGNEERVEPVSSHSQSGTWEDRFRAETNHLRKRLVNNRQTMQQSSSSLKQPENYQRHVLDAVHNTVREYRAIFRNYAPPSAWDCHLRESHEGCAADDAVPKVPRGTASQQQQKYDAERKELGNGLFTLTQQALQCGPLAGAKAGYMKRCDPSVARRVLQFLDSTFPDDDDHGSNNDAPLWLDWSSKQFTALHSWRTNARHTSRPSLAKPRRDQMHSPPRCNKEDFS